MLIQTLKSKIESDPALRAQLIEHPEETINTIAAGAPPLQTDVTIYRIVVGGLSLVVILAMGGAIVLAFYAVAVPDVVVALGSAAIGALAGLLAPSPRQG